MRPERRPGEGGGYAHLLGGGRTRPRGWIADDRREALTPPEAARVSARLEEQIDELLAALDVAD